MNVKEYWFFIAGIRDDWELEGLHYNGFETLFIPFVPSRQDLASLGKHSSYHIESIEKFSSTSLPPNEAQSDRVRSAVFIRELKRADHSMQYHDYKQKSCFAEANRELLARRLSRYWWNRKNKL